LSGRVIVFSSHNIFTEGVANRLREISHSDDIQFIDADEDNFIQKVAELEPSIFIIDSAESDDTQCCLLCELLNEFPDVTIIRLKIHEKDVQVIISTRFAIKNVQDLIDLIGNKWEGGLPKE
jgi:DNA-binding NarL/FixJ family response regulator